MGRINVLGQHIANMIAAGEVVENPASVVKELVENAIDAHSQSVTVEIQNGGITYIRVTDDGSGMEPDDAKTAFLRHATSKISKADDLEKIATLGFRGEALAAISSVSKIDLITKAADAEMGVAVRVEAGQVIRESESGCPDGTTIIVRELFYNTPARMRFLKKDATEAAAVEAVVKSAALSHPEVSVKFIKDGKDILHTPGDGIMKNCIYALFGRDFANNMHNVSQDLHGMKVSGFTCSPQSSRGNRAMQFFFVNGRPIKSRMLSVALDNAYKERIMKGRFPTCVLMMEIPLGQVDVNVHPAKTEVKFARERDVFDLVYFSVKTALEKSEKREIVPPQIQKAAPIDNITENQTRIEIPEEKQPVPVKTEEVETPEEKKKDSGVPKMPRFDFNRSSDGIRTVLSSPQMPEYTIKNSSVKEETLPENEPSKVQEYKQENEPVKTVPQAPVASMPVSEDINAESAAQSEAVSDIRYIGEAMNTYIIVESAASVIFIDKHAAHERIIFEKLRASVGAPQTQLLLIPEIMSLDKRAAAALLDNREEVLGLGFEIDDFGDGSVAVSAVPDGIDAHDAVAVLDSLAETLASGARASLPEVISETMYSVACKAAIKAGQKNSPEELFALAKRVLLSDDIRYCPHGRPVMIEYTKNELEKKFKRIV
ncbi:MAG: DNA mismatch repair endonuclease MutL [Ruminococcaceae bacterium]|nr:DNA mismatch repair endonuclease MutL [Oscillospiraceae bacterium]